MKKLLIYLSVLCTINVFAIDTTVSNNIKAALSKTLPKVTVDNITDTPVPNIYQIISNKKVFYVDGSGRYLFVGNLIDLNTRDNLTQDTVEKLSVVDWSRLPLKIAIRRVNGNGKNKIAIFTDPDCPFCKRLEEETIPSIKNTTIYYFLFPLSIHPDAENDAKKIICSEIPNTTYLNWMKDGTPLPGKTVCNNTKNLVTMEQLGKQLGIEVVPTIILPNGKIVTGLIPADYLNQLIVNTAPAIESNSIIESTAAK